MCSSKKLAVNVSLCTTDVTPSQPEITKANIDVTPSQPEDTFKATKFATKANIDVTPSQPEFTKAYIDETPSKPEITKVDVSVTSNVTKQATKYMEQQSSEAPSLMASTEMDNWPVSPSSHTCTTSEAPN